MTLEERVRHLEGECRRARWQRVLLVAAIVALGIGFTLILVQRAGLQEQRAADLKEQARAQAAKLAYYSSRQTDAVCVQVKTHRDILRALVIASVPIAEQTSASAAVAYRRYIRELGAIGCPPPIPPPPIP